MYLIKETSTLQLLIQKMKEQGTPVGFVPTMGALHEGHLTLIRESLAAGCFTVCSIYVNPTQFNQSEDFRLYPRTIEKDISLLKEAGCQLLFHPETRDIYPDGAISQEVNYGLLTHSLEGAFRPGHFDGVIAIVRKLLMAVRPDQLFMGRKDYQQCAVIQELIRSEHIPVTLHKIATVREADGLAMSSRNQRLSATERESALVIHRVLSSLKTGYGHQSLAQLKQQGYDQLSSVLRTEYLEIVDGTTFEPITEHSISTNPVALVAAWCGQVRLIDNMELS